MPAASNLRDYLLPYAGISSLDLLDEQTGARMMSDINAALQEMFRARPRRQDHSEIVRGPTAVTIGALTQYSKEITFTGYQPWMLGCTVRIGNDKRLNKFTLNDAGTVELEAPYFGSTTTNMGATVYGDAVNLPCRIGAPYPPVLLDTQYVVEMLTGKTALNSLRQGWSPNDMAVGEKPVNRPQFAIIEDFLQPGAQPRTRFLFESLPDTAYLLSFEADLAPPRVSSWEDTAPFFLPGGQDESLLWPWARFKFSSWPNYIGDRREAETEFQRAMSLWQADNPHGYGQTMVPVGTW